MLPQKNVYQYSVVWQCKEVIKSSSQETAVKLENFIRNTHYMALETNQWKATN